MTSVALSQLFLFGGTLHWPQWALLKLLTRVYLRTHSLQDFHFFFLSMLWPQRKLMFWCDPYHTSHLIRQLMTRLKNIFFYTGIFISKSILLILRWWYRFNLNVKGNMFTYPWGISRPLTRNRKHVLMNVFVFSVRWSFYFINILVVHVSYGVSRNRKPLRTR